MCFLIHFESIRTFSEWNLLNPVQYDVFYMTNTSTSEPSSLLTCKLHTAYCKGLFCCHVLYVFFLFSCGIILRHHLSMNMLFYKRQVSNVYGHIFVGFSCVRFFFFVSDAHLQSHISWWQVSYGAERTHKRPNPPPLPSKAQGCQERLRQFPSCVTEIRKKHLNL